MSTPRRSFDVVVLGCGAAGLTAALAARAEGASVAAFEKSSLIGGTTSMSGGIVWMPNNPAQAEAGIADSTEAGIEYMMALSHGLMDREMIETLVTTGPEAIRFLERTSPLRFDIVTGYPDYQPEHPGGLPTGGRSLECELFPFGELGPWADRVRTRTAGAHIRVSEGPLGGGTGRIDPELIAARRANNERGTGQALVAGLLKGLLDHGATIETDARATRLLTSDGRVVGVEIETAEGLEHVDARSVIIATGGFEWDADLVRTFLRGPMTTPASPPTNTGDGLRMAMRVGAALGTMREAWWAPVWQMPTKEGMETMLCLRERTLPRSIIVNRDGRRFVNEAANYNALSGGFHAFDATTFNYPNLPCWLVFDQEYLTQYGFGPVPPAGEAPAWIASGRTPSELAAKIGVDPIGLERTIAVFNAGAEEATDPAFGRGSSAYDGWSGDRSRAGAQQTLGPLDAGPYYAVQIFSGALGTKGGPLTDEDGRVLDVDGRVIEGLHAAGNAMAGVTGMTYGGAGGTLGPALTFGYRAGRAAAAVSARSS
ncbi:FAD-dependent oxidoreductase [Microbacterium sp. NPDC055910]|uniref:FAD-dependent oxidoreductase n=1 Tax=Microbacterium sp. NPDC055910 TaxID=3345659 RepID=UPI0035DC0C6D